MCQGRHAVALGIDTSALNSPVPIEGAVFDAHGIGIVDSAAALGGLIVGKGALNDGCMAAFEVHSTTIPTTRPHAMRLVSRECAVANAQAVCSFSVKIIEIDATAAAPARIAAEQNAVQRHVAVKSRDAAAQVARPTVTDGAVMNSQCAAANQNGATIRIAAARGHRQVMNGQTAAIHHIKNPKHIRAADAIALASNGYR